MGFPGPTEWIIPLFIILLLFGTKRLPELARSIGKALKEFKKAVKDVAHDIRSEELEEGDKEDKAEKGE